ncbi:MAG: FAD-binding protein, partial [Deltaproteobacteria bacterium]|nr:FAD-binding protein [Deltaproteobacteria bacterium]
KELPAKHIQFKRYGIDISKEPMLVYPTLHYQNGGLQINANGETTVPGLYSAGEVTGGVHGRNRLMGNSLLDILVFGRRAGMNAAEYIKAGKGQRAKGKLTLEHVEKFEKELKAAGIKKPVIGPMILPEYTPDHVRARKWG